MLEEKRDFRLPSRPVLVHEKCPREAHDRRCCGYREQTIDRRLETPHRDDEPRPPPSGDSECDVVRKTNAITLHDPGRPGFVGQEPEQSRVEHHTYDRRTDRNTQTRHNTPPSNLNFPQKWDELALYIL